MLAQWQRIVCYVTKGQSWRVVITRKPPASRVLPANKQERNSPVLHYRGNTGIQVLLRMQICALTWPGRHWHPQSKAFIKHAGHLNIGQHWLHCVERQKVFVSVILIYCWYFSTLHYQNVDIPAAVYWIIGDSFYTRWVNRERDMEPGIIHAMQIVTRMRWKCGMHAFRARCL
jgi:hypothetical protein